MGYSEVKPHKPRLDRHTGDGFGNMMAGPAGVKDSKRLSLDERCILIEAIFQVE
jgi:hypothetical protein